MGKYYCKACGKTKSPARVNVKTGKTIYINENLLNFIAVHVQNE